MIVGGFLALTIAATGIITACWPDGENEAEQKFAAFLNGWEQGKLPDVDYTTKDAPARYAKTAGSFAGEKPNLKLGTTSIGDNTARATVTVTWQLGGGQRWTYDTTVVLKKQSGQWHVDWTPATLHPQLKGDDALKVRRGTVRRGEIKGANGATLVTNRPVVQVTVTPREVTDPDGLAASLSSVLAADGVDTKDLPAKIRAAKPTQSLDIVTLRKERYDAVKSRIHGLPGLHFADQTKPLANSKDFARALLGTVGPVTKEMMDKNPGKYRVSDQVGKSGLQERYQDRLAGTADVTIETTDGKKIDTVAGQAGQALTTTIDLKAQNAADAAVAAEGKTSALVAIRVSDGAIVAVGNGPSGTGVNLAFEAATAPGSTFKMVTAWGYLNKGVTPDQTVNCPKNITVGGKQFKNDHDFELGAVPFHTDFAKSCNTAFASLAGKLGNDGLAKAAAELGIGGKWDVGLDANTGSVSTSGSDADHAAASFGQGKTAVSPLAMASAVAAVARGQWKQPTLVADPAEQKAADGQKLDGNRTAQLKSMMREVVTGGTATQLTDVPGGPVSGKTGTAEYGDEKPPRSHGWFVGFQGDIAVCAFVQDGGSSAPAVALTERFLRGLR